MAFRLVGVAHAKTRGYKTRLPGNYCAVASWKVLPALCRPRNEVVMLSKPLLRPILEDDALTRGLGDAEARVLVEWLVDRAEDAAANAGNEEVAQQRVLSLRRRSRAISRFVELWCHTPSRGAASQLAACERFGWPLPEPTAEAIDIMEAILAWESEHSAA
jgi:hypothetical protein